MKNNLECAEENRSIHNVNYFYFCIALQICCFEKGEKLELIYSYLKHYFIGVGQICNAWSCINVCLT